MAPRLNKNKRRSASAKQGTSKEPDYESTEYQIQAIVAESEDKYQVAWEDTWLDKSWVSQTAIDYWTQRLAEQAAAARAEQEAAASPPASSILSPAREIDDSEFRPSTQVSRAIVQTHSESSSVDDPSEDIDTTDDDDTDWHSFTLVDGSQIRVRVGHYVHNAHAQSLAHTASNGHQQAQDAEQSAFRPRPQGCVISSTTQDSQSDLVQAAQQVLTQSEDSQAQHRRNNSQIHSSSKDSSGLLSQNTFPPPSIVPQRIPEGIDSFFCHNLSCEAIVESSIIHSKNAIQLTFDSNTQKLSPIQRETPSLNLTQRSDIACEPRSGMSSLPAVPPMANTLQPLSLSPHSGSTSSSTPPLETGLPVLPHAQHLNSLQSQTNVSEIELGLVPIPYDTAHLLALAMTPQQREQYWTAPEVGDVDLMDEIASRPSQEINNELLAQGQDLVQRLRWITTHPDLDTYGAVTQYDVSAEIKADWDSHCSTKFQFLRELLERSEGRGLHYVIAVEGGGELRLIRRFLNGINVPLRAAFADDTTTTTVTILDELEDSIKPADLVISLNVGWNGDPPLVAGRYGSPAPCVQLVVPYTVEHIELALPRGLSEQSRLKVLLENVAGWRQASRSFAEPGDTGINAQALIEHLCNRLDSWPLPELKKLPLHIDHSAVAYEYGKRKRPLEDANDSDYKRQRLDEETLRFSNESLLEKLTAAEVRQDELEKELLYTRLKKSEYEKDIDRLFDITQELREQLSDAQGERDTALKKAARAHEKANTKTAAAAALREERVTLDAQLREADIRFKSHVVPERAELEQFRKAAQDAAKLAAKAQGEVDNTNNTLAYIQGECRNARSQVVALTDENISLTERLEHAEKAAALELCKVRQMSLDNLTELIMRDNKKLKMIVESREAMLALRDEEIARLKDAGRGRIGTRASSVPRTPRMGSPMKSTSRHGSPAAGELRERGKLHPLSQSQRNGE